ncbi:tyrosine-type recombinase/integrase [Ureibacillus aquaedulcis]|uniref:Site-specific integrase n=1 Tax=Ureibacillus aquaedulcis TaxID=3058421 RepID=A0ABT8GQ98_9BACL|nr:site-specific integrase [Ureibacillus sp. BA0131]MDN4493597.1 site-specific integrase [Ureibacillus sp. BA0131]
MTKKSGLFNIDFDLEGIEIIPQKSNAKVNHSKKVEDALCIILQQMQTSGYRTRTMKDYETIVLNFQKVTNIEYVDEVKTETIYEWLESMQVTNQTKLTRLKALKSFLSKCYNNGWYNSKFWQTINVKVDKKVKKGAKPNDIQVLLSLIDSSTFIGLRDATAILTMYKTGIRINTLGLLEEHHVDFENKQLVLDGSILKNHQLLKLPIDEQLIGLYKILIKQNRKIRAYYKESNTSVFISNVGTTLNTKSTNNAISKQLTKYSKKFGLENMNPHAIRRAYAKNLLNKGASIALISKALGHQSLDTTTLYLDLDVEEVAKDLREYL